MSENEINLIVILGPTASGKTSIAVKLARDIGSEIISADSRQVYRGMDIGAGKELAEYEIEGKRIPYHLIDIVDPDYEFNLFEYQKRFFDVFEEISARGIIPIMAGGTGLYIESVLDGYMMADVPANESLRKELETVENEKLVKQLKELNPRLHNSTDLKDRDRLIRAIEIAEYTKKNDLKSEHFTNTPPQSPPCQGGEERRGRSQLFSDDLYIEKQQIPIGTISLPEINPIIAGIKWPRDELRARIKKRLDERLESGMIEEVESLHEAGLSWEKLDFFGLEYRFISQYLKGELKRNDMVQKLASAIGKFAKRQETWFRRMERKGTKIEWINGGDYKALREYVLGELSL